MLNPTHHDIVVYLILFNDSHILISSYINLKLTDVEQSLWITDGDQRKNFYFYFTIHSTHFKIIIWCRTYGKGPFRQQERKSAVAFSWATFSLSSKDSTYHELCYTSCEALAGMRNGIHHVRMLYHGATSGFQYKLISQTVH